MAPFSAGRADRRKCARLTPLGWLRSAIGNQARTCRRSAPPVPLHPAWPRPGLPARGGPARDAGDHRPSSRRKGGDIRRHATLRDVDNEPMRRTAELLRNRNAIDAEIAAITGLPMTSGHLGEWIGAQIFGIELEPSAAAPGVDGLFLRAAAGPHCEHQVVPQARGPSQDDTLPLQCGQLRQHQPIQHGQPRLPTPPNPATDHCRNTPPRFLGYRRS